MGRFGAGGAWRGDRLHLASELNLASGAHLAAFRLRTRLRRTRRSYQRRWVTGKRLWVLLDSLAGEVYVGGELSETFEVGLELFLVGRRCSFEGEADAAFAVS